MNNFGKGLVTLGLIAWGHKILRKEKILKTLPKRKRSILHKAFYFVMSVFFSYLIYMQISMAGWDHMLFILIFFIYKMRFGFMADVPDKRYLKEAMRTGGYRPARATANNEVNVEW